MTWQATDILVAGGGIGGLAAGVALSRAGASVRLIERSEHWGEVGAGIQIGPNVTRLLEGWGLGTALAQVAFWPRQLQARDARTGQVLGSLPLAERAQRLYGAPYGCIHRADLHALLLAAAQRLGVDLQLGQTGSALSSQDELLTLHSQQGGRWQAQMLVGADGLWGRTRAELGLLDAPRFTGHLAYRALVPQEDLPAHLRTDQVTVWMGPRLHVVHYPVQGGNALNLVAIVHGELPADAQGWDAKAQPASLMQALGPVAGELQDRLQAMPSWRLWALHDRPPVRGPQQMAHASVALLGDAAHPMRPYLAQGAGMAIEDAHALAQAWGEVGSVSERLQRYAQARWQRNARVQSRAIRNGEIFHAQGPVAWARNASMRLWGERVMDLPWLYAGP